MLSLLSVGLASEPLVLNCGNLLLAQLPFRRILGKHLSLRAGRI